MAYTKPQSVKNLSRDFAPRVLLIHMNEILGERLEKAAQGRVNSFRRCQSLSNLGSLGLLNLFDFIIAGKELNEGLSGIELAKYIDIFLPYKSLILINPCNESLQFSHAKLPQCVCKVVDSIVEPRKLIDFILAAYPKTHQFPNKRPDNGESMKQKIKQYI